MIWRFSVFLFVSCFHVFNSNYSKCVSALIVIVVLHAPTLQLLLLLLILVSLFSIDQANFSSQLTTPKMNNERGTRKSHELNWLIKTIKQSKEVN